MIPIVNKGQIQKAGTPDAPAHGDKVLHCGHMVRQKKHCLFTPVGILYKTPDGVEHKANWAIVCDDCWKAADGNPTRVKLRGEGQWDQTGQGNARPVPEKEEKMVPAVPTTINIPADEN